jgi:hypothetical protein
MKGVEVSRTVGSLEDERQQHARPRAGPPQAWGRTPLNGSKSERLARLPAKVVRPGLRSVSKIVAVFGVLFGFITWQVAPDDLEIRGLSDWLSNLIVALTVAALAWLAAALVLHFVAMYQQANQYDTLYSRVTRSEEQLERERECFDSERREADHRFQTLDDHLTALTRQLDGEREQTKVLTQVLHGVRVVMTTLSVEAVTCDRPEEEPFILLPETAKLSMGDSLLVMDTYTSQLLGIFVVNATNTQWPRARWVRAWDSEWWDKAKQEAASGTYQPKTVVAIPIPPDSPLAHTVKQHERRLSTGEG